MNEMTEDRFMELTVQQVHIGKAAKQQVKKHENSFVAFLYFWGEEGV